MILNPILMLLLAGLTFVGGTIIWSQTDDLRSGIPFVVFTILFCVSLFTPVVKMDQVVASSRAALKTFIQVIKLTAEWGGALAHYGARYLAQKRFEMARARRAKSIIGG